MGKSKGPSKTPRDPGFDSKDLDLVFNENTKTWITPWPDKDCGGCPVGISAQSPPAPPPGFLSKNTSISQLASLINNNHNNNGSSTGLSGQKYTSISELASLVHNHSNLPDMVLSLQLPLGRNILKCNALHIKEQMRHSSTLSE